MGCAILVEGIMRYISVKLYWICTSGKLGDLSFKDISIFARYIYFSGGGYFVQQYGKLW